MSGQKYAAGGIRTTVAATRAASDEMLLANATRLAGEMQARRHHDLRDQERLRAHHRRRVASASPGSRAHPGDHLPRRARRPGRIRGRCRRLRRSGHGRDARRLRARMRNGSTCSARPAPSMSTRPAPSSPPDATAGSECGCTRASSASPGECGLPSSWARHPSTTARSCRTPMWTRSQRSTQSRHCCRVPNSRPASRIRMRVDCWTPASRSRSRPTAIPGSSYTTSMSFCIAVAVRDMGMTPAEALRAATAGGARGARVATTSDDCRRRLRADLAILRAPSYVHLAYRPGVPLISQEKLGAMHGVLSLHRR